MSTNKVPVLCRFGGNFIWESDKVYYKGGTNRIVHVDRQIDYRNLLSRVHGISKLTDISSIKYKYPSLDLDALVLIENNDDVANMMKSFPQSSEPIQIFVFGAQNLSIPIPIPSNLMQNANNENLQAFNGPPEPSLHNGNANNNDVPSTSNDLREISCYQELPRGVVDSCVNDMPKMMLALKEGQEFEDANAFHKALREFAICSNFEYKRTRSGGGRYQAKCINDSCSWRIHACKLPDKPTFKIKSLKGDHTCNIVNESTMSTTKTHRQASRKWIAALVKDRLQKDLRCTPKDIVDEIRQKYGIKVSYDKAWRGKELALKEMALEQYVPDLSMLCKDIEMTNPGSTAKLSRSSDNSLRLFVAYKAASHGFKQACRPLVRLDCMKMEGKCRCVWLFAMAIDAADNLFPISYAFVESKNAGSWKWFCDELAQVLGCIPKLTFISERQEGILEVVSGIFPYAYHRYSQEGLIREIQHKFRYRDLDKLFERAVYAGVCSEFDACMPEIQDKYKEAWNIVKDINPKHWVTCHFEEKLYFSERHYLYATVKKIWHELEGWRELPITRVLVNLHAYMIEIFNERLEESSNWETLLVPNVEALISEQKKVKDIFSVSGGTAEFEVRNLIFPADPMKVDLERRACSCLNWQICGYPCYHAVGAIRCIGGDVYGYIDVHYRVDKYRETYSEVIHPLHLPNTILSQRKKRKYGDFEAEEASLND